MKKHKMYRAKQALIIPLIAVLAILAGCYTVPVTGRKAFIIIDEQSELQLGLQAYTEVKEKTSVVTDPEINDPVQRIGSSIAQATDRPDYDWEFTVFDQPDVQNAFCLPGGKVGISTGIFEITRNETGLATVIAHEAAHAIAKHGAERYSQGIMVALGAAVLEEATDEKKNKEMFLTAYGIGSTLFVALPHSRKQENEADHIGLIYMARAGYDPREAVGLWQRFAAYKEEQGNQIPQFLSTHPTDEARIRNIEALLPQAMPEYYRAIGRTDLITPPDAQREGLSAKIQTRKANSNVQGRQFKAVPIQPQSGEILIRCPHCGTTNKIPADDYREGAVIKCGNCGKKFK